ncbi:MAG TPA: flagellar hook-associated protein 3 [Desulfotomaculum sp.]|nr:flagellar hook-associated protein 3 [Desulfotomaculum sp.]
MRITNKFISSSVINNIHKNMSKLARTYEQVSTSKSMIRLSDKPENLSQVLSVKASLSYMEQYEKNIDDGLGYLNLSDSSMQTLGDLLHQAGELAVQGSNETYDSQDRKAIAEQIDKIIDHVKDLANSSIGGRYIYAGTKNNRAPFERVGDSIIFTGDFNGIYREVLSGDDYRIDAAGVTRGYEVKPLLSTTGVVPEVTERPDILANTGMFTITRTGANTFTITDMTTLDGSTPDAGLISPLAWNVDAGGNIVDIDVNPADELYGLQIDMSGTAIGDSFRISINHKQGVFGHGEEIAPGQYEVANALTVAGKDVLDQGVFDVLFKLRDSLGVDDTEAIMDRIDEVQLVTDQVLERRVGVGSRTRHFEALQDQMRDMETKFKETLNLLEGADMYKLSIDMSQEQASFEASLASGANIMKVSLLDFLR